MDSTSWEIHWRWKEKNWLQWVFAESAKRQVKIQAKTCYFLITKKFIDRYWHKKKNDRHCIILKL